MTKTTAQSTTPNNAILLERARKLVRAEEEFNRALAEFSAATGRTTRFPGPAPANGPSVVQRVTEVLEKAWADGRTRAEIGAALPDVKASTLDKTLQKVGALVGGRGGRYYLPKFAPGTPGSTPDPAGTAFIQERVAAIQEAAEPPPKKPRTPKPRKAA